MKPSEQWEIGSSFPGSGAPLGVLDALRFLQSNFLFLLGGIALGVLAGLYAQHSITPAFEARGKFVVDQLPFTHAFSSTDAETDRELVQTLIISISSRDMRSAVEAKLHVPPGSLAFMDLDIPLKLRGASPQANISIQSVKNSRVGTIEATSQNPEFAASVVNAILEELHVYNQLGGRLRDLQLGMELNKLKADSLIRQLVDAGSARNKLEQENAELDDYLKRGLPLASFPTFASDPTLGNLRTQFFLVKSEYDRTSSTSTRGERLLGKRAEMEGLQSQLDTMAKSLAVGLRSQLEISKTQEKTTQSALTSTKETINEIGQETARLTQSFGDPAEMKIFANQPAGGGETSANIFVIVDKATPSFKPVRPRLWLNIFLGVAAGGALALAGSILHSALDTRVRFASQIEQKTGCTCLAVLPKRPPVSRAAQVPSIPEGPKYSVGLAYVRSLILHAAPAGGAIIGFSPTRAGTATSELVADLAILLASEGKTALIVDLNLSKPRAAKRLGITVLRGLDEFLTSDEPLSAFVATARQKGLAVLGAREGLAPEQGMLGRRPLADGLGSLKPDWDFILLDGPCILNDWGLLLSLPPDCPLFLTAEYSRTRITDIVRTLYHTRGPQWRVPGLFLLGSPRRKA